MKSSCCDGSMSLCRCVSCIVVISLHVREKFMFYVLINFKPVWRLENRSDVRGFRGSGISVILESYKM